MPTELTTLLEKNLPYNPFSYQRRKWHVLLAATLFLINVHGLVVFADKSPALSVLATSPRVYHRFKGDVAQSMTDYLQIHVRLTNNSKQELKFRAISCNSEKYLKDW
jgi:hypothetical protein